jgi:hypothetical protein
MKSEKLKENLNKINDLLFSSSNDFDDAISKLEDARRILLNIIEEKEKNEKK